MGAKIGNAPLQFVGERAKLLRIAALNCVPQISQLTRSFLKETVDQRFDQPGRAGVLKRAQSVQYSAINPVIGLRLRCEGWGFDHSKL